VTISDTIDDFTVTRRAHYGRFFGLDPLPDGFGVVVGNCQAESLRILIDSGERPTVRVPPVHELGGDETRRLHELIGAAAFVVTQPIRDGYHGLPLGTAELAKSVAPGGRLVTVPSVRFDGLHPFQLALRIPGMYIDPPVVAYHDVRTLAAAADLPTVGVLDADMVREIGESSIAELRRREAHTDVAVSDLFAPLSTDHMRTVNHPGNTILLPLAARVLETVGLPGEPTDLGRPLLAAVRAPLESFVLEAWDLADDPRDHWLVDGRPLAVAEVREAQLDWYAQHPEFVRAAVDRAASLLKRWQAA
jgi:hypothetical protein